MNKFTIEDIKEFLKSTVFPKWVIDGRIKGHRPISYTIAMVKEDKRRTYDYIINLNSIMAPQKDFGPSIKLQINKNTFQCNEYDFSIKWQEFLAQKVNTNNL